MESDGRAGWRRRASRSSRPIPRFKGLGEMDADELWDTTMNPATRAVRRITLDDVDAAEQRPGTAHGREGRAAPQLAHRVGQPGRPGRRSTPEPRHPSRSTPPWHAARAPSRKVDLSAFDQAGARVLDNPLVTEVEDSYLEYAYSVIHSRALPDARDGLKPVHRRILYSMHEQGYRPDRAHVKSARVVGDVMGRYHPHGDVAIYDAMVRLAQDFSLNVPLIDGHGNFGSPDDGPAAAAVHRGPDVARGDAAGRRARRGAPSTSSPTTTAR